MTRAALFAALVAVACGKNAPATEPQEPDMSACDQVATPGAALQDLLDALPDGGTLCLEAGTHTGTLWFSKAATVRGLGEVTVDGDGADSVITVSERVEVVVEGLTVTGGSGDPGGAVTMRAFGNLTLRDCVLTGNRSRGPGGAVWLSRGSLLLERCTVRGNTAPTSNGVHADGVARVTLRDTVVEESPAAGKAAVQAADGATLTLERTTITAGDATAVELAGTTTRGPTLSATGSTLKGAIALAAARTPVAQIVVRDSTLDGVAAEHSP